MARASSVAFATLAGLALLLGAGTAHANPPDTYGFGSRETAMGNAAAAETHGYAANYYNPAALVRSRASSCRSATSAPTITSR